MTLDRTKDGIKLHSPADFEGMRKAGRLAAEVLDMIAEHVEPGVATEELDRICHEYILAHGATPAPLGYHGFPKSTCISINHVICHGIPGPKKLNKGDILNIDVTVILNGWHGDSSRMYKAGKINRKAERLIDVTHECLMRSLEIIKPGATFGDIGAVISEYAHSERYSVVEDFCGHGLGQVFHDAPNVKHYGRRGAGPVIEAGMFFTVEPMINIGRKEAVINKFDGWTATTRDKSLSAQFEHTIGITDTGIEIFTESPTGRFHKPQGL